MDIYKITFIGHRELYNQSFLEERIELLVKEKLICKEYVELYVGRNGDFDISAASAVKRAQKALDSSNSSLILVQPYRMKDDVYYAKFYDELKYPIEAKTHPKAAVSKRNQWMIDNADLLIACVEPDRKGGAMTALRYAEKRGIEIVNLALKEK